MKSNTLNLLCFSYAGGSANFYLRWRPFLQHVNLIPIDIPGHGNLFGTSPLVSRDQLIEYLIDNCMKWCNEPFAFFGHSLGARIAFELASVLENEFSIVAKYLFISGCLSPERFTQAMKVREKDLSDLTLIEVLTDLGGTPPELLDKYSLMKEALPVIRADFQLAIDISKSTPLPINVPISLFLGSEDRVTNLVYDYSGWANQTAKSCQLSVVNGNHFFIRSNMMAIVRVINKKVKELLINGN